MNRLIVAFVLFCAVPVFADSFQAGVVDMNFDTGNNSSDAPIFIHGVSDGHPNHKFFFADATSVSVLSLTCAQGCAGYNATVAISGLTMSNVLLADGQHFSKLFVDGVLTLNIKSVPSLPFELGHITGTFEACFDAACNTPIFSFFTDTTGKTFLDVTNNGGVLTLNGGSFATPEPGTLGLMGTGLISVLAFARKKLRLVRTLSP
jgi:PEP-CTERM motif-containing protein